MTIPTYKCEWCQASLSEGFFYKDKNGNIPMHICKKCINQISATCDNLRILDLCHNFDIPFLDYIWDKEKEYAPPAQVFGKYLSRMKLKAFKSLGFKDSTIFQPLEPIDSTNQTFIHPEEERYVF